MLRFTDACIKELRFGCFLEKWLYEVFADGLFSWGTFAIIAARDLQVDQICPRNNRIRRIPIIIRQTKGFVQKRFAKDDVAQDSTNEASPKHLQLAPAHPSFAVPAQ